MRRILVTGMSGTGKSSALQLLKERGFESVDTDTDDWCTWVTLPDGSRDWIWDELAMTSLLTAPRDKALFVAGCKTNQGTFYSYFDEIVLLSAPVDVLLARVAERTTNPYGKSPEERQEIVTYIEEVEPRLRAVATVEIDTTAPLLDVVDQLAKFADS